MDSGTLVAKAKDTMRNHQTAHTVAPKNIISRLLLNVSQKHPTSPCWSTGPPASTQKMKDIRHHHKYISRWNRPVDCSATGAIEDHDLSYQRETRCSKMLLTKAFADQSRDIGWLPFLQGKLSKYCRAAFMATLPKTSS
jgi:hypothetical protein